MASRLTLCADDFGADAACTEAILQLAGDGRINAATVMPTGVESALGASALAAMEGVEIGLHVTLSDGSATRASALAPDGRLPHVDRLMAAAFAARLPLADIEGEIERQYDHFEALFGRAPDFVDAHQHSHVLPGIRRLFLDAAARRAPGAWVRTCEERTSAIFARGVARWRAVRSALLSNGLSSAAAARGVATNQGFAGLYDLKGRGDYGAMFKRWLVDPGPRHLVICHPSGAGRDGPYARNRVAEHAFLSGEALPRVLSEAGMTLAR